MFAPLRVCFLALLMIWALSHASVFGDPGEPAAREPSPAEKVRKVLDQPMALDYQGGSMHDVIGHLKEKTKIHFVMDIVALQQMGLGFDDMNMPPPTLNLKSDRNGKLRAAIQRMLNPYNLTLVILEDSVLITTEEMGLTRQMRQRVSVNLTNVPLSTALKDLARSTALNLIIDPRLGSEQSAKVTLQLDDATLETTVRLVAELGNLKAVRMGNVLFVTNEARAEKLRREEPPVVTPSALPGALLDMPLRGFGAGVAPPALPVPPPPPEKK
jgi:hypothetical protein